MVPSKCGGIITPGETKFIREIKNVPARIEGKEKTVVVIPKEVERLETAKSLPVQVMIEGFNKDDDRANIRWKVTAIKVQE